MFRRGDLFGFVYSYRHRGNPPIVSIDELGKMLDARMISGQEAIFCGPIGTLGAPPADTSCHRKAGTEAGRA